MNSAVHEAVNEGVWLELPSWLIVQSLSKTHRTLVCPLIEDSEAVFDSSEAVMTLTGHLFVLSVHLSISCGVETILLLRWDSENSLVAAAPHGWFICSEHGSEVNPTGSHLRLSYRPENKLDLCVRRISVALFLHL